jgi:hypothetical protein
MFLLKYKVQALEDELVAKQAQVVRDRAAIRVLEAEWTYLNDPERLRELSAQYLGFGPPAVTNIADISALPMKGASEEATEGAPVKHNPLDDIKPQFQTELRAPRGPSIVSVTFARLQRLLFPTASATPRAVQPTVKP